MIQSSFTSGKKMEKKKIWKVINKERENKLQYQLCNEGEKKY